MTTERRKLRRASCKPAAIQRTSMWPSRQGKRDEARELLQPVHDWFTEGFDTRDLKDAKVLPEELA